MLILLWKCFENLPQNRYTRVVHNNQNCYPTNDGILNKIQIYWQMVLLYCAFNHASLHRLCITFTHSQTHSYTDGRRNHARHQPSPPGTIKNLAEGLFDTNWEPFRNPLCSKTFLMPEPLPLARYISNAHVRGRD